MVDAASRNAQLQEQAKEAGNKSLIEGLQSIGQVGESLFNTRQRVAQSLAIGRQTGIADDVSRTMTPEQLLELDKNAKYGRASTIDPGIEALMRHVFSPNSPNVPGAATPASGASTPNNGGPVLASTTTATPLPDTAPSNPLPAGSMPVPVPAPPLKPKPMNTATFNALLKLKAMSEKNNPDPVVTKAAALAAGSVPHGTRIESDAKGPTDIMDPTYQGKLEKQYADMRMKALSNRSGGLGLQDSKVNQAFDLRKLVNKYYDPKTDTFNIPPSQHAELALGLARLVSPTGQVGIELMHELRQSTGREALSKALIYAGMDPAQVGGPTQSVAKMFVDAVDRQGQTAEQLRDQYMQYISDNSPTDLEPARKAKHDKGKLNSFNDFLSKSPDQSRQSSQVGGASVTPKGTTYTVNR